MPDRPLTRQRVVAGLRRRARVLRKELRARTEHATTPSRSGIVGVVEVFTKDNVSGWVAVPAGAPPVRVSLLVNDLEVAASWATDSRADRHNWGEIRPFAFRLRDVWSYTKKKNKLSVRVDGRAVPIAGHGMYLAPEKDGRHDLVELQARLAGGHIFGQKGKLQLSKKLDTVWQARVMGLYDRVRAILHEAYGYDAFFVYGTLLGAVREAGVIGHDLDFDAAYLSRHSDGRAAAKELQDIAFLLIDNGLDVECMRTALHIHDADDPETRIDLFHLYFDDSGLIRFPFGVAGTTEIARSDWTGTRPMLFCGSTGLVPNNAEQFAEHIYGAGWRSPKPGFDWNRDRTKRDWTGVLPLSHGQEVYWENFYARTAFDSPSPFFAALDARSDLPATVIELGSGDGRDSIAFAAAGRHVHGLDRSERGIRHATERATEQELADRARFRTVDFADNAATRAALVEAIGAADGPVLFYLRFLLHAVADEVQDSLLPALAELARPGDLLAAEFRTEQDETRPKAFGKHFRRFQNGPAFGSALSDKYGFAVIDEQEGTGLARYGDEDPVLYRVLARRRAD